MKKHTLSLFSKLNFFLALLSAGGLLVLSSCEKQEEFSGTPVITQVRLLNPEKRDSSFTSALPGTQVLVEGQNLGGVVRVLFNDYAAGFNTVYNTNNNLIVTIPSNAPTEATRPDVPNTLRLVTTHGEATYNFVLDIPPPAIAYIVNENALPGDSLVIVGTSLWLVDKVTVGSQTITDVTTNADGTRLGMIMPDLGTEPARVTIQAKYGTTTSRAPINLYAGPGVISNLTADGESGEPSIFNWAWWGALRPNDAAMFPGTRGAYLHSVFGGVGADNGGWWENNRAGNFNEAPVATAADLGKPAANYALKFEVNTKEPWTTAVCLLRMGDNYAYRWMPFQGTPNSTFHTNGKWQTVTVPLSEFKTAKDGKEGTGNNAVTLGSLLTADGKAAFTYRIVSEGMPIDVFNAAFDNFRVVALQ